MRALVQMNIPRVIRTSNQVDGIGGNGRRRLCLSAKCVFFPYDCLQHLKPWCNFWACFAPIAILAIKVLLVFTFWLFIFKLELSVVWFSIFSSVAVTTIVIFSRGLITICLFWTWFDSLSNLQTWIHQSESCLIFGRGLTIHHWQPKNLGTDWTLQSYWTAHPTWFE